MLNDNYLTFCLELNELFFTVTWIFHTTLNSSTNSDNKVRRCVVFQCCPVEGSVNLTIINAKNCHWFSWGGARELFNRRQLTIMFLQPTLNFLKQNSKFQKNTLRRDLGYCELLFATESYLFNWLNIGIVEF